MLTTIPALFAGYATHEALSDHSSLAGIRQRWGFDVFRRISYPHWAAVADSFFDVRKWSLTGFYTIQHCPAQYLISNLNYRARAAILKDCWTEARYFPVHSGLKHRPLVQPDLQASAALLDNAVEEAFAGVQLISSHEFIRSMCLADRTGAADDCRDAGHFVK